MKSKVHDSSADSMSEVKYKGRLFDGQSPKPESHLIGEIETLLQRKLPEDYLGFLNEVHAATLDYEIHIKLPDLRSNYRTFGTLFQIVEEGSWCTNPFELNYAKEDEQYPEGLLPFAMSDYGDYLFMDLTAGYKIMALIQGSESSTGETTETKLVQVADSFDDYLSKLTISDETMEDHIRTFDPTKAAVEATVDWFDSARPDWRTKFKELWNQNVERVKI